jgi:spoIIIJ-associated protein
MAEKVQARGKTVDDAIESGLKILGLTRAEVKITVVSEGSRGVFGIGGEDAVVELAPRVAGVPVTVTPAPTETLAAAEIEALGQQALEHILQAMGLKTSVIIRHPSGDPNASDADAAFILDIVGGDLGILIGRRGETLRALEYVVRLIVAQRVGQLVKFVVDVEGYRARRERALKQLAQAMAERVKQNRQPITLEAMPPHERRIVHLTLHDHPVVKTHSIGIGDHRRVMILPK